MVMRHPFYLSQQMNVMNVLLFKVSTSIDRNYLIKPTSVGIVCFCCSNALFLLAEVW